jgi:ribonuclease HI
MTILSKDESGSIIRIRHRRRRARIHFSPENRCLTILSNGKLSDLLRERKDQLESIFCLKKRATFYPGFRLRFVLQKNHPPAGSNKEYPIIVSDKTGRYPLIYRKREGDGSMVQIITDGSGHPSGKTGAYSVLLREPGEISTLKTFRTKNSGSNRIEMLAVIRGLEMTRPHTRCMVITDSRYIIKGITTWIYHWKLNRWRTANGEKVKDKKQWKKLDRLMNNRYLEFKWVKAHEDHPENNLCDFMARQAARK